MPPIYDPPSEPAKRGKRKPIKGTDSRVRKVTDSIGRGTRDVQAEQRRRGGLSDMAETQAQDDFARRLQGGADAQVGQALYDEGPKPRTKVRGRGNIPVGWDEDPNRYFYHYAPDERFPAIKESGALEPGKPGHFQKSWSRGVHFAPGPNDYAVVGDEPKNVYRFERKDFGRELPESMLDEGMLPRDYGEGRPLYRRSDVDLFSPERVPGPEVYTGSPGKPRWSPLSNTFGRVGTGAGLLNMLSSFLGGPYLNMPSDMVINDLINQAYSGGIMDPYRDIPAANMGTRGVMA